MPLSEDIIFYNSWNKKKEKKNLFVYVFVTASKLTKPLANCELKVSPLNKIKISSTPPAYMAHNGTNIELNSLLNIYPSKNCFFGDPLDTN